MLEILQRNLIFVCGKGGVGKTTVSRALAVSLAKQGHRTLWVVFEDPLQTPGEIKALGPRLWSLNCEATHAFEEYAGMIIGVAALTRIFLQNKLMRYLAKAAPGIHELVLLGKVWHERMRYDRVVIDMPATGHGLAMFHSTRNFAQLFSGGPLHRDAQAMLDTFANPQTSGFIIVALPEEMPLRESLELHQFLKELFPKNPAFSLVNRRFPAVSSANSRSSSDSTFSTNPDEWVSPVSTLASDFSYKRDLLEKFNLKLWQDRKIIFEELPLIPLPLHESVDQPSNEWISEQLAQDFQKKGWFHKGKAP